MKDATLNPPAMTDEQYQAEVEILLVQMRLMREQIRRDDAVIEQHKASTRANLDAIRADLNAMRSQR